MVSIQPPAQQMPIQGSTSPFVKGWREFFQNISQTLVQLISSPTFGSPLTIDGPDGTTRVVNFTTNGKLRWAIGLDNAVEGSGVGGSDLTIWQYDNTGTTPTVIFQVARGTGAMKFSAESTPAVTGSRGGNAALQNLLSELALLGLITNSTTA